MNMRVCLRSGTLFAARSLGDSVAPAALAAVAAMSALWLAFGTPDDAAARTARAASFTRMTAGSFPLLSVAEVSAPGASSRMACAEVASRAARSEIAFSALPRVAGSRVTSGMPSCTARSGITSGLSSRWADAGMTPGMAPCAACSKITSGSSSRPSGSGMTSGMPSRPARSEITARAAGVSAPISPGLLAVIRSLRRHLLRRRLLDRG